MKKQPLKILVRSLVLLLLVTVSVSLFWAFSAEWSWEQSGGHRMRVEMKAMSLTGFAQEDESLIYDNIVHGLQLSLPAGWNIDQDEGKQPLRVLCTSPNGDTRIYAYMSRNPKDFRNGVMSQTIADVWQLTSDQQTSETINERKWQVDAGTMSAHGMAHYRMYTTASDYWGLAIVYMTAESSVDQEMAGSIVASLDVYLNYDNVGSRILAYPADMIENLRITSSKLEAVLAPADVSNWHPLDTLQAGLDGNKE